MRPGVAGRRELRSNPSIYSEELETGQEGETEMSRSCYSKRLRTRRNAAENSADHVPQNNGEFPITTVLRPK